MRIHRKGIQLGIPTKQQNIGQNQGGKDKLADREAQRHTVGQTGLQAYSVHILVWYSQRPALWSTKDIWADRLKEERLLSIRKNTGKSSVVDPGSVGSVCFWAFRIRIPVDVIMFNILDSKLKFSGKSMVKLYIWLKWIRIRSRIRIRIGRSWMPIRDPQQWIKDRQRYRYSRRHRDIQ